MFKIVMEAALPKLSQTSLFGKMNSDGAITNAVREELANANKYRVTLEEIQEIAALIKLNGDLNIKKVMKSIEMGEIIILFHKDNKKIPTALPFLVTSKGEKSIVVVFADKVISSMTAQREYTNLMATLEAAYFALQLYRSPNKFISNRSLMQVMCNIYALMVTLPLEQRVYMKGEYLTKAMLYAIAWFYRIIDGRSKVNVSDIPYKKIIAEKVTEGVVKEIFEQVASIESDNFMELIKLIQQLNPLRYKDLEAMYMQHFTTSCGAPVIFATENLGYLFLMVYSSLYKTQLTQYNANKTCAALAKKASQNMPN